jgi:hypothetical protein
MKRALAVCAAVLLASGTAAAKDVYKAFLDPAVPHHRAILDILAQIEANPSDAGLFNDLGCLVAWDGFWRDALRNFKKAAKLDKGDTRPMYNAGIVYLYKGEWGSARSAFQKAVDRGPGNWEGWWMLGYSEEMLGNVQAAIDAYAKSLRVDTTLFDVRRNPFAANSRLKAIVLTTTYDARVSREAMPATEEFADEARIAALLKPSRLPPGETSSPAPEPAAPPAASGPVVTNVPAPASAPSRAAGSPPASSRPYRTRPAPPRGTSPAPGSGAAAGTSRPVPGPGSFDSSPPTPAGAPQTGPAPPQTAPGPPPPSTTAPVPGPGSGA